MTATLPERSEKHQKNDAYRITLTAEELNIPGLASFGHAAGEKAEMPVIDHRHKDKFEFVLQVSGVRRFSAEGVKYTVYAKSAFLTLPNEAHAGEEVDRDSGEIYWFQLDISDPPHFLGLSGEEALRCHSALTALRARQLALDETLLHAFRESFALLSSRDALVRSQGHALFLYALLRMIQKSPAITALTEDIDRAKQYILAHIQEAIDPDELLLLTGLSMQDFRRKFEKQIGQKPRDYINRMKIEAAAKIVAQSRKSLAEIAYAYHFSSVSIFKMHFKKYFGISPSKYRRECRRSAKKTEREPF